MHRIRREMVWRIKISNAFWADSSAAFSVGTTAICFAKQLQFRQEWWIDPPVPSAALILRRRRLDFSSNFERRLLYHEKNTIFFPCLPHDGFCTIRLPTHANPRDRHAEWLDRNHSSPRNSRTSDHQDHDQRYLKGLYRNAGQAFYR